MILRSAGFVTSDLIGGQNAVNFAYILYLRGRAERHARRRPRAARAALVRHVASCAAATTGSPETAFDFDIRQIEARGLAAYADAVIDDRAARELLDRACCRSSWTPRRRSSPYFLAYQAAQVKLGDKGFLSRDITVQRPAAEPQRRAPRLPAQSPEEAGPARGRYNQIANFVLAQSEINIAIGDKPPEVYFEELAEQCDGGKKKYGGITDDDELRANLRMHCLPESLLDGEIPAYDDFLEERRKLMAQKIKTWFEAL